MSLKWQIVEIIVLHLTTALIAFVIGALYLFT
jgi:hypothetical protein